MQQPYPQMQQMQQPYPQMQQMQQSPQNTKYRLKNFK
jgi:hypothetical protein